MSRIAAVLLTFSLAACGMKGPLELPPGPAPEPLLGTPKPAKPATKASPADVSTTTKTNTQ
ncbi:LPS translocon maturation chaperone LptM [Dechloromonas denitrificans]|uniref:LPS translocon maturation chaperone LptM n=1 Tax=Azonexaceae TaxID=2008795 RepID=UPI001CF9235E|nr:lipoprotein [Dechloromonas denitrificans]UCV08185.1 lipoprotein [Dechloromonas denitrificans]